MNNKGFTMIEILGTVTILGILSGLAIISYNSYVNLTKMRAYDTLAKSSINAAEEYIMDHPNETEVSIATLYDEVYLERPSDPGNKGGLCTGKVTINKVSGNASQLGTYSYTVTICCTNYNATYTDNAKNKTVNSTCQS